MTPPNHVVALLRVSLLGATLGIVTATWASQPQTIVAFGDSTTAPRGPLKVYADRLREALADRGHPAQVINAGVGGNSTALARARFQQDVLDRRPDIAIIQFGINDAAVDVWKDPPATMPRVPLDQFTDHLHQFVTRLKETQCRVILMTPNPLAWTDKLKQLYGQPPYQVRQADGLNVLLREYSEAVRHLAKLASVPLVDVEKQFVDFAETSGQPINHLLLDGMHPNDNGHRLIAAALLPVVLQVEQPPHDGSLIASITKETLWRNRRGDGQTWFHPRACMMPDEDGQPIALMNLQAIGGSDYFGPVHWSISKDLGRTWSDPEPIPALGRDPVPGRTDGLQAGVCDVTPQYHPPTDTVIALGHVVFYKGDYFARKEQLPRYPVYVTRSKTGQWSERKILAWNDPRGGSIYTNNCGQRVVRPDGTIQMSFTFGPQEVNRMVAGVRATFDGQRLSVAEVGPPLHHRVGRGLLEPSVTEFGGKFWITIRAEDGRGYVSVSEDGMNWEAKRPWAWDDGSPLEMSTTQQHWLTHSDGLFLVYTRKDVSNSNVIRWRAPLWVARVDAQQRCLIRSTEQVVLRLVGDGVKEPDKVALMGNFNVTNASRYESWVTVGEWMPRNGYRGDVLLARIRWSRPNRLPLW